MTDILPKLDQIPPELACVQDYEAAARARLTAGAWAYLSGGAADELTLAENLAAFRRIALRSRAFPDVAGGSTRLELFGQELEAPILLAPVAYQRLAHPAGEAAAAAAAAALGVGMAVSTQASMSLEEIAGAGNAPLWFQLYIQPDRGFTRALVQRAEAAGYRALVVTADAPVGGPRNREQRAGFVMPPGVEAVNLRGAPSAAPAPPPGRGEPFLLNSPVLRNAAGWADLEWLRTQTRLPILVKGVMAADDARACLDHGAGGVIVSNHGGRTLDGQIASIDALPRIVAAIGGRAPVLMDGGVRRGADVFRALALGAGAVLIGRPYVWGLAAAGALGVAHVLRILREELEIAMALTGCRDLSEIDATRIEDFPAG